MASPFAEPIVVDGDSGGRRQRNDNRLDISVEPGGPYLRGLLESDGLGGHYHQGAGR